MGARGFQGTFQDVIRVLRRPHDLERLVRECVADGASDGAVWIQPHFNPHILGHLGEPDEIMDLMLLDDWLSACSGPSKLCVS